MLHEGFIAEMKTGEGKTLVATLPAYLNALTGKGVHVVTVNDYLAERDANLYVCCPSALQHSFAQDCCDLELVLSRHSLVFRVSVHIPEQTGHDGL